MDSSDQNDSENALKEKLEELESLLGNAKVENQTSKISIPVLDELVTEADFVNNEDENDLQQIEEQIVELADKLEHKFSDELDQLVRLLKDNLKNSIIEELRVQANLEKDGLDPKDELADEYSDANRNNEQGDS